VHPSAWLPANATSQLPIPQPIDLDDHALFVGLDFDHSVGFQAQLFSDKRSISTSVLVLSVDV